MTVLCLVELDDPGVVADASQRALTFARGLCAGDRGLAAVVFDEPPLDVLAAYGVGDVFVISGIPDYAPAAWARSVAGLLSLPSQPWPDSNPRADPNPRPDSNPRPDISEISVVVAGATDHGNEVLAHVGAMTGLPMAANCVSASRGTDGELEITRQRWAGLLLEESVITAPAALMTVAVDAVSPSADAKSSAVAVHAVTPELDPADLVVRAVVAPADTGGASLATARVVVGGGRGVGSADGFSALEELASLLGGVVGVSRVVTSEGWRPHTQQVGQTGTKITPELYLACGISGAIQHVAGCSGAKHIIAINTDPAAPMMSRADYAVIGDLHEIIPALVQVLRDRTTGARSSHLPVDTNARSGT